ncbi:MAG: hypothetical protein JJ975_02670 [Bacteroidia bacterium]|nr:hypothetical protein [Bacteroidia bacterium]
MKIVRVTYTVRPEYVEQNKANIEQVMNDLRALNNPNTKYASYLAEDGVSFMHFAQYPDEETAQLLNELPSFAKFRQELKASNPVSPPQSNHMTLVGAAFDLFN